MTNSVTCQFRANNWAEQSFAAHFEAAQLAQASISNVFSGAIEGHGVLQYLLVYPLRADGAVAFVGIERIVARMADASGSFVVRHDGWFSPSEGVSGDLQIIPACGSGDFLGLAGRGRIMAKAGEHSGEYRFAFLPAAH
jgi:hypothetical protein